MVWDEQHEARFLRTVYILYAKSHVCEAIIDGHASLIGDTEGAPERARDDALSYKKKKRNSRTPESGKKSPARTLYSFLGDIIES